MTPTPATTKAATPTAALPAAARGPRRPLQGRAVHLRSWERGDMLLRSVWLSDAEVLENLAEGAPFGIADCERWFETATAEQGQGRYRFVICRSDDGAPIGSVWFEPIDHANGTAEFGIYIGERSAWGHGHGSDALETLCAFGFGWLRLERIWLRVRSSNVRARRSYEKAGFREEGIERSALQIAGDREDVVRMAILVDEWRQRRAREGRP